MIQKQWTFITCYKRKNKETKNNINLNLKSDKNQYQTRKADNICIARIRTNNQSIKAASTSTKYRKI